MRHAKRVADLLQEKKSFSHGTHKDRGHNTDCMAGGSIGVTQSLTYQPRPLVHSGKYILSLFVPKSPAGVMLTHSRTSSSSRSLLPNTLGECYNVSLSLSQTAFFNGRPNKICEFYCVTLSWEVISSLLHSVLLHVIILS